MKIPFSPPYIDDSVINEVMDSLKSGWITTGPKVKALEGEVMKSINRLPEDCRRVFSMSRFDEKKYEEIAHELQISVNTVKYHIKHALTLLHEDLGKYL